MCRVTDNSPLRDSSCCHGPHTSALAPFPLALSKPTPLPWGPQGMETATTPHPSCFSWTQRLPQVPAHVTLSYCGRQESNRSMLLIYISPEIMIHTEMPTARVCRTSQHTVWSPMCAVGPSEQKPTCCFYWNWKEGHPETTCLQCLPANCHLVGSFILKLSVTFNLFLKGSNSKN